MRWLFSWCLVVVTAVFLSGCSVWDGRAKAGLQVITNDIPTSIFLDGQYLDKTPLINKDLKPGTYTLKIQPEDNSLSAYETTITLHKGLLSVVTWKPGSRPELSGGVIYEMEKLPNKKATQLALISIPDGAIVSLDGQSKDFAPIVLDNISAGQHEFTVSLPSYETQQHTLNMVAGHKINVTVKLARSSAAEASPSPTASSSGNTSSTGGVASSSATATASGRVAASASPKASGSPSASPKASATPKASASPKATPAITGPRVRIKSTNFYQDDQEVLRVRATPSSGGTSLGFATVGSEHPYLEESEGGWHKITFEGKTGWVTGQFAEIIGAN